MKAVQSWFDEYGVSHQNRTNKLIHWICVPLIFFSIIGLLAAIPTPWLDAYFPPSWHPYVHFGSVAILFAFIFYLRLSAPLAAGLLVFCALCLIILAQLQSLGVVLWQISLLIFAAAWVGQFIGHKIEGKKPSFFKDVQFLLIGPAWLMGFIYQALGIKY